MVTTVTDIDWSFTCSNDDPKHRRSLSMVKTWAERDLPYLPGTCYYSKINLWVAMAVEI